MDRRTFIAASSTAALLAHKVFAAPVQPGKKGVMLMNRIGPSTSELFIANADGTGERKFLADSQFEYNASFSADGRWVSFTSERRGDGQSDLYRARADGTGIERLSAENSMQDAGALSPDGTRLAFVSTREGYKTNVWLLDLKTRHLRGLTIDKQVAGEAGKPDGYFRPSWSPDGQWIAFSSDRNTPWRGHDEGHGWEHTQELSVYIIRPDGTGFRKVATKPGYCLGSPKWSPDGKRIVFYEITTEGTWGAHRPEWIGRVGSQIVSVDVASGERVEHTSGPGLKVSPHYLNATQIAYHIKGGPDEGIAFVGGGVALKRAMRSPAWSPDGKHVIYQKVGFKSRPQDKPLYSWDKEWEYRFTDVFPVLARDGTLAITEKQNGTSGIVIMRPDGSGRQLVYDPMGKGLDPILIKQGLAGAFQPAWSPDSQWIVFGVGSWFQKRVDGKATVMRVRRDGTGLEALTDGTVHSGFPSYSADGKEIVFRVWGPGHFGLRIINLADRSVRTLTTEVDNLPFWSPDGSKIVFTRKTSATNFDIFTVRPDGSDPQRLTTSEANDGHAVWTEDGRIMWSSGMYGFRDEAALYDNTFQPYGQIMLMNADGSGKRMLTDSLWEDSMPLYIPASVWDRKA
ncbi:MAG: TolB family protein [Caulobacteraceae bacterium]